mgnify:CR=1 FL=1
MKYDIAVIGGGPAGMMAAGRAGELRASVVLLEKNNKLGIKLLMTGGGRCNITNQAIESKSLVDIYGKNGKFLFSALSGLGVSEVIDFFQARGVKIKTEQNGRVFPVSNSANDILKCLKRYLVDSGVEVRLNSAVKELIVKNKKIEKIILTNGEEILADKYIICVGGKSYPASGSAGDGYAWLKKLGHEIVSPLPALAPIIVKNKIVRELEGLSLKNVEVALLKDNEKIITARGEMIFTSNGLSGPLSLNLSREIGRLLPQKMLLRIDFYPDHSRSELEEKVLADFRADNNKAFKNYLVKLLSPKLSVVILKLSGINPAKQVNSVSREERKKLIDLLKGFDLEVAATAGFDQSMVTAGGVKLSEIDPKTMKSKLISNLYLAGEVLDLDGPTGGYNLQICWSAGYRAGESAATSSV